MTLDRSPEFCFKRLIYRYLLETGHAPDDLSCGHVQSQGHNWNLLNVFYQLMLHTKYQGSRPGGFKQDSFMLLLYVSQCKKECMARKCNTHKLHTNPRHQEEESKNNNSLINSVSSRAMQF